MARPMPNAMLMAYYRRMPNRLGDDLSGDFQPPVFFHGRFTEVKKQAMFQGALGMNNSQSAIETYDLNLAACDLKKDDMICPVGVSVDGKLIVDSDRIWRVNSVSVMVERIRLASPNAISNQVKSPKRIEVQ